jgi:hypothetical protein
MRIQFVEMMNSEELNEIFEVCFMISGSDFAYSGFLVFRIPTPSGHLFANAKLQL